METDWEPHFQRIKDRLVKQRELLHTITAATAQTYRVPNVKLNEDIFSREYPLVGDKCVLCRTYD